MTEISRSYFDPRRGDEAAGVATFDFEVGRNELSPANQFAIYFIEAGSGVCEVNEATHPFETGDTLCLAPYQHVLFRADTALRGLVLRFHANFVCLEIFHAEVGCNSKLFDDPFGGVTVRLSAKAWTEILDHVHHLAAELIAKDTGYTEAAIARLKLVLVGLARTKLANLAHIDARRQVEHPTLLALRVAIEANYTRFHTPADYARLLHVTPKSLGRLVRQHHQKSLTTLIRDRLMTHAKWQVLHTLRPIKDIAFELGFDDEFYFSRLFKQATGLSPTLFRSFETEIRSGSNLSRQ